MCLLTEEVSMNIQTFRKKVEISFMAVVDGIEREKRGKTLP